MKFKWAAPLNLVGWVILFVFLYFSMGKIPSETLTILFLAPIPISVILAPILAKRKNKNIIAAIFGGALFHIGSLLYYLAVDKEREDAKKEVTTRELVRITREMYIGVLIAVVSTPALPLSTDKKILAPVVGVSGIFISLHAVYKLLKLWKRTKEEEKGKEGTIGIKETEDKIIYGATKANVVFRVSLFVLFVVVWIIYVTFLLTGAI